MILVVGATGRVGRDLVLGLAGERQRVRILVRDPERAAPLLNPFVTLTIGDASRPASLAAALAGIDRVFLATAADPDMVAIETAVVDAAARAGVRHLVKLSCFDAAAKSTIAVGRWHAAIEAQLEASGIRWTHLRPSWFVQNLLAFAPQVASEHELAAPAGEGRIAPVDVRDVAAVAAHIVVDPEPHAGRAYVLTGPEAVTFAHLAARIAQVTGEDVRYVDLPVETARAQLQTAGMPDWRLEEVLALYASIRGGELAVVTDTVQQLLGTEARSADAFLRDHAFTFGA